MSITNRLASALGRRDEQPNQELAEEIAAANDAKAVKEVVDNLQHKSKDIQSDCVKVLYEVASIKPGMVSGFATELLALLDSKNNRMQWGAMSAINAITGEAPGVVYAALPRIIDVADKGTVITNDHCVGILTKLAAVPEHHDDAVALLLERVLRSPENQFPSYAEQTMPVISTEYKDQFSRILKERLANIEKESKRKRVEKIIHKLK
jgi:hypothetical protein